MQPAKCPLKCGKIVQEQYNMTAHIKACIKKHLAVSFNCFIVVFICIWTFFLVVTAEEEKMIFWWKYWYIHVPACNFQKNLQCDKCSFCISSEQVDTFMEHFSRTMQCLQVWRIYCLWSFFFPMAISADCFFLMCFVFGLLVYNWLCFSAWWSYSCSRIWWSDRYFWSHGEQYATG